MQEPRSNSTLELVVNEQQMQNMSRVDLRPNERDINSTSSFGFEDLKRWPTRFRENFSAKMDEAKAKSGNKAQFVFEVIRLFSGTLIWLLCFIFTIKMPIVLLIIGLINLDDCIDRPALPYLIFSMGFVMTASNLFNLAMSLNLPILSNQQSLTSDVKNIIASIMNILFNCVVAFLYILSAYMVYTVGRGESSSSNSSGGAYISEVVDCNSKLYSFSFWFITLTLGFSLFVAILAIILFAYNKYRLAIIRGSTPRSQGEADMRQTT